jgi:hypothetical protein
MQTEKLGSRLQRCRKNSSSVGSGGGSYVPTGGGGIERLGKGEPSQRVLRNAL